MCNSEPQSGLDLALTQIRKMHVTNLPIRKVADIPFAIANLRDASRWLCERPKTQWRGGHVHLLNAYSVALAETDAEFRECVCTATCNFPDGKPISLITKITSMPLSQVRGPSVFEQVMDDGRSYGLRHYLLGSTPETLDLLVSSLKDRYPGVEIVGSMSPPFHAMSKTEYENQDREIRDTNPDIVWVGLGTPKQDFEAQRLATAGDFFAIAVGAAFDFSAGTKKEAPRWLRALGGEWLFRLAAEPKRLWRRYLIGNFVFLYSVIRRGL